MSELSNEFNRMWQTDLGWQYSPIARDGDLPTWRRSCDLFTFFVTHKVEVDDDIIHSNRFEFSVELTGGGGTLLVHPFQSMSWDTAEVRANEFIQEFFKAAFLNWRLKKPEEKKLRLRQIVPDLDRAAMLALSDDGELYRATKTNKDEDGSLVQVWELVKSVVK